MADKREKPEVTEIMIPVFSVLKKGVIIKNIILTIWPKSSTEPSDASYVHNQNGDLMLIGRHPDSHIVLDHPSISRFHLEVRTNPALQQLSVTDRSSVHGTWVSGNKIQPNVPIDLAEGDTVRLGASTREYRLQWVPMSRVVEMESPLAVLLEEDEEILQEYYPRRFVRNPNEAWVSQIPSAPPMPAPMNSSYTDEPFSFPLERKNDSLGKKELGEESSSFCPVVPVPINGENRTPASTSANEAPLEREHLSPLRLEKGVMSSSLLSRRSKSISFLRIHTGSSKENVYDAEVEVGLQKENGADFEEAGGEDTICRVLFDNMDAKEEEASDSDKENITPGVSSHRKFKKSHTELQISSLSASISKVEEDVLHTVKENWEPRVLRGLNPDTPISGNHMTNEREEAFASDKENLTPNTSSGRKLKKSLLGLQRSYSNVHTALSREEDVIQSDKEKWTPEGPRDPTSNKSFVEYYVKIDEEDDSFPSDKENLTPKGSGAPISKKPFSKSHDKIERQMMQKRVERVPFQSLLENSPSINSPSVNDAYNSSVNCSSSQSISDNRVKIDREDRDMFPSDKENPTAKVSEAPKSKKLFSNSHDRIGRESMRKRAERVPFQSLLENSPSRNITSFDHACNLSVNQADCSFRQLASQVLNKAGEEKKKWNIVVDTSCFLDEESKGSLQLLEGLKGTHLIIPSIVIRELDYLKRRESLFRKATKASSVLQWIEMCMVRVSWWIHVQSSLEMMPVAPTPPVSPQSQLGDGSNELLAAASNSMAFSTCGSLMEIVSPTAEDHILDCALLFKKLKNDGQFILLTNSITLKIKAMAEGLLCETPIEFRQSLVNPYSKRFLWANSSPRGSTWSCSDEVLQTENYCHQYPAVRKTVKATEGAKGLKLILLHNSYYGKTNSVK